MKKIAKLAILFAALSSPHGVFADGFAKLAAIYLSSESDNGGSKSESTRTLLDLNAGYVWPKGMTAGVLYSTEKLSSGGSNSSRNSYGPSFGWITRKENGAYVIASYLFSSELETYKGWGYQADLGYKFNVRKFGIGLQVSYKSYTYKENNGAKLATPMKQTYIDPYFALLIQF